MKSCKRRSIYWCWISPQLAELNLGLSWLSWERLKAHFLVILINEDIMGSWHCLNCNKKNCHGQLWQINFRWIPIQKVDWETLVNKSYMILKRKTALGRLEGLIYNDFYFLKPIFYFLEESLCKFCLRQPKMIMIKIELTGSIAELCSSLLISCSSNSIFETWVLLKRENSLKVVKW